MNGTETSEPIDLDLDELLGFRDLSGLGDDAGLVAEELDAAHVKIGEGEVAAG